MQVLNAHTLKCTVVLDPAEVAQLAAPDGHPRVAIAIRLPDRQVTADLNAKSVRRAVTTIAEHGPDGVAVIVQGKLAGDTITEAGIFAQPKAAPKETPEPQATPETPPPAPQAVATAADARFPTLQAPQDAEQPAERPPRPPGGSWLAAAAAAQATAPRPGGAWLDAATEARRQRDALAKRTIEQRAQQQRDDWTPKAGGRQIRGERPLKG